MKKWIFVLGMIIACTAITAQGVLPLIRPRPEITARQADSAMKDLAEKNIYATRKYAFAIGLTPFFNISNSNAFCAFDLTFTARLNWLHLGHNANLETDYSFVFVPYQGAKLSIGLEYELLNEHRVSVLLGGTYCLNLAQQTKMANNSIVTVGFHHYLEPHVGVIYWPGKESRREQRQRRDSAYDSPGFWQLFYVKATIGYSWLISTLQVDTSGGFDRHLYNQIRENTMNTLNIRIAVGINIPNTGGRRKYAEAKLRYLNRFYY